MRRIFGLLIMVPFLLACKETVTGPTVTDADLGLFNQYVTSINAGQDLEWGGNIYNRSRFVVEAAIKLEMINPDSVVFFTTTEHLIEVDPVSQVAFKVVEDGDQIPTPVFSSIIGWKMHIRLIDWKSKAGAS